MRYTAPRATAVIRQGTHCFFDEAARYAEPTSQAGHENEGSTLSRVYKEGPGFSPVPRARETLPHVYTGTMFSPWPPCSDPRTSARIPGRVTLCKCSPLHCDLSASTTRMGLPDCS